MQSNEGVEARSLEIRIAMSFVLLTASPGHVLLSQVFDQLVIVLIVSAQGFSASALWMFGAL